jgi:hypothetical protein
MPAILPPDHFPHAPRCSLLVAVQHWFSELNSRAVQHWFSELNSRTVSLALHNAAVELGRTGANERATGGELATGVLLDDGRYHSVAAAEH